MQNTIPERIADFLKEYPPFQWLERDVLRQFSTRAVVLYRQPGEWLYRQGDAPGAYLYVVREGAVQLLREENGLETLVEVCDEGDVFGLWPLRGEEHYPLSARITEESLLYALRLDDLKSAFDKDARMANYLNNHLPSASPRLADLSLAAPQAAGDVNLQEVQMLGQRREPVTCPPDTPIQEAAAIMSRHNVGSIVILNRKKHPVGIVTDKDLRRQVATGQVPLQDPVSSIMSSPVITAKATVSLAEVQIAMLRRGIHHLCLTADGTNKSAVTGVVSEHDLLVLQANNPAVLIREIKRSATLEGLRSVCDRMETLAYQYLQQEVSVRYVAAMMAIFNDTLAGRLLELATAELEREGRHRPDAAFCWLALGSEARGEQMLRTDQDNAIVFSNVGADALPAVQDYYLRLATKVNDGLFQCGYAYCPANMMARNPQWCLSLDQWKKQFSDWIQTPEPKAILHSSIFFDFRPVAGDHSLAEALWAHIASAVKDQEIFLGYMAKNALENPPPLTFFRQFMVERSGEHEDEFDIKARAIMPLVDAARVLTMEAGIFGTTNTFERFAQMAALETNNQELYELASDAYALLLRFRTLAGFKNGTSGRFFKPEDLSKMERLQLRNSFLPLKELETLLRLRFRTDHFPG